MADKAEAQFEARLADNTRANQPAEPPAPRDLAALHRPHELRVACALLDGRMEELPDGERPLYWMWRAPGADAVPPALRQVHPDGPAP